MESGETADRPPVPARFVEQVTRLGYQSQTAPGRDVPYVVVSSRRALVALIRATDMEVTWQEGADHSYVFYPRGG